MYSIRRTINSIKHRFQRAVSEGWCSPLCFGDQSTAGSKVSYNSIIVLGGLKYAHHKYINRHKYEIPDKKSEGKKISPCFFLFFVVFVVPLRSSCSCCGAESSKQQATTIITALFYSSTYNTVVIQAAVLAVRLQLHF